MTNGSFQEQMHDLWRTRPVRLPGRGYLAGVCAGIGYRYGVDPVLIRVAFVLSTIFGGAGVLLYLAAWITLTKSGDTASPAESLMGRGHSSDSSTKTIVLLVALAIALTTVGPIGVGLGGSGVISMALMLGGLWLLYQRQPSPPPYPVEVSAPARGTGYAGTGFAPGQFGGYPYGTTGYGSYPYAANQFGATAYSSNAPSPNAYGPNTATPDSYTNTPPVPEQNTAEPAGDSTADAESAAAESNPVSFEKSPTSSPSSETSSAPSTPPGSKPPEWDPLGVAPFAWDLPEPEKDTIAATPVERRRSRLTTVVIGLAILAAAAATAVSAATESEWLNPSRIGAIALAVIGVGLLIGSFLRRGYGLLVVTGPLIGYVILASIVSPLSFDRENTGDQTWTPMTAAEIAPAYSGKFGKLTLDLRNVTLTEDRTVDVSGKFGEVEVILPADMDVKNRCTVAFGASQCLGAGIDGGTDGTGGHVLNLNADVKFGGVEVRRG
ncbi:PspC domain-containing protein [Rhodococcus sp. NPDC049939]|uniref:PspC domain-containing protein n=1 Tax=Rhodococcus sp. NPDC049939 TaxID=3155511 RepID=UPI0033EC2D39